MTDTARQTLMLKVRFPPHPALAPAEDASAALDPKRTFLRHAPRYGKIAAQHQTV